MESKLKVMNLYAGIGGNIELLDESKFEITNVEINPKIAAVLQKRKQNQKVIVADAHKFLLENYMNYDIIWSSRPCQSHSRMAKFTRHKIKKFPDMVLYEEIIFLMHFFKGKWIVENVKPYYEPLVKPTKILGRHLFWSNFDISDFTLKQPDNFINKANLQGKKEMMEWIGIYYDENIYYDGNHCPVQVLRNCVHPLLGKHIFDCCLKNNTIKQHSLFECSNK